MKYGIYTAALGIMLFLSSGLSAESTNQAGTGELQDHANAPGHERGRGEFMMRNPEGFLLIPEARVIIETYRIKIMKVFSEAREAKLKLRERARNLKQNLDALADKYQSDKSVSKDIVSNLKDFRIVQTQIQKINRNAMKKIQALDENRQRELKGAVDRWFGKIESDTNELDKFIDEYKNHESFEPRHDQHEENDHDF